MYGYRKHLFYETPDNQESNLASSYHIKVRTQVDKSPLMVYGALSQWAGVSIFVVNFNLTTYMIVEVSRFMNFQ